MAASLDIASPHNTLFYNLERHQIACWYIEYFTPFCMNVLLCHGCQKLIKILRILTKDISFLSDLTPEWWHWVLCHCLTLAPPGFKTSDYRKSIWSCERCSKRLFQCERVSLTHTAPGKHREPVQLSLDGRPAIAMKSAFEFLEHCDVAPPSDDNSWPPQCVLPVLCLFSFPACFQSVCLSRSPQPHYRLVWIGGAQLIVALWEQYERRKRTSSGLCGWRKERCDSSKSELLGGSLLPPCRHGSGEQSAECDRRVLEAGA